MKAKTDTDDHDKPILRRFRVIFLFFSIFFLALCSNSILAENSFMVAQLKKHSIGCTPTLPEALGPFYKPNAPVRSSVGKGYQLSGKIISSRDCAPIQQARIEFWMAGPDGDYRDDYRAIVIADGLGEYQFESHVPPSYLRRPPHIHVRVTAPGFKTLVTQYYPDNGSSRGEFDLVLIPK